MSANANIVDLIKGTSTLVRPRFSPGLLLRDDDLRVGVDYTRELSRLLFRSLFGCGVVCGLQVRPEVVCDKLKINVDDGVAMNCLGDPIHVPDPVSITVDPSCGKNIPPEIWVTLCHTEKCCAPRSSVCSCDDDDGSSVCTREYDGFEIRLVKELKKDCACACAEKDLPKDQKKLPDETSDCWCVDPCDPCYQPHYSGTCECGCCDGDCVVLAVLKKVDAGWTVNHSVRRFARPVLMRDPVVYLEQYPGLEGKPCEKKEATAETAVPASAANADVIEKATKQANQAAMNALQKTDEVRAAIAAGKLEDAELAAEAAKAMAVEAQLAAKTLAEKASAAAVAATQEMKMAVAARKTAERAIAEKIKAAELTPAESPAPSDKPMTKPRPGATTKGL